MKIVVYQSQTGFTKEYAQWIAEACGCEAINIKQLKPEMLADMDQVIFGGWIMGNMIMGLDKIRKMNPSNLVVYAVGSTPKSGEICSAIKEQNHLEDTPFFYLEGGFRFKKVNLPMRMMLKALKKSVAKKENKTEQEAYMAEKLGTSFEMISKEKLSDMLAYLKQ